MTVSTTPAIRVQPEQIPNDTRIATACINVVCALRDDRRIAVSDLMLLAASQASDQQRKKLVCGLQVGGVITILQGNRVFAKYPGMRAA